MSLFESDKLEIGTALDGVMTEVLSQDIRNNGGSGKFTLLGILHTDKKVKAGESSDFYVYRIESIDEIRDYVKNAGSEIYVSFMVPFGLYAKELYPNRANMEFSVIKEDVSPYGGGDFDTSVFIEDKDKVRTNSERYKAVFLEKDNPKVKGGDFDFADKQSLDLTGIVTVKLQLLNRSVEVLRTVTTGGCYSGVSRTDLIRSIVGRQANNIKIDGKPCLDALDICKADNKLPTQQVLLKQTLNVIHLPAELQEKHGGVYSTGLGSYIQKFNGLNTWFVFPLYDTTRYQDASRKAIFYAIRKDKFVESEKTFTRNQGNQYCHILVTGEKVQTDDGESSVISDGVGFRQMSPDKFLTGGLESFIKATEKGPMGLRSKNVTEVINAERLDGVSYAPASEREISVNNFAEYSRVAYRLGSTITFTWNSADPELLYPGMPCKYVYDDAGTPREVYGVVLFVQALTQMDNPTIVSSSSGDDSNEKANEVYSTNCVVGIFAEKMKHGDEKPPTLSDLNVFAEAGGWSTAKDTPVTNARTTFTPVSGGVYVTPTSSASSNVVTYQTSETGRYYAEAKTVFNSDLVFWYKRLTGGSISLAAEIHLGSAADIVYEFLKKNISVTNSNHAKDSNGGLWNIPLFIIAGFLYENAVFTVDYARKSKSDDEKIAESMIEVIKRLSRKLDINKSFSSKTDRVIYESTDHLSRWKALRGTGQYSLCLDYPHLFPVKDGRENKIPADISRKTVEAHTVLSSVYVPVLDTYAYFLTQYLNTEMFRPYLLQLPRVNEDYFLLGTDVDFTYVDLDIVDDSLASYKSYLNKKNINILNSWYATASCPDMKTVEYFEIEPFLKVPLASLSDLNRGKSGYFLKTFRSELRKLTIAQVHAAMIWDGLEGYTLKDDDVMRLIPNFSARETSSPLTETTMLPYVDHAIRRVTSCKFFDYYSPDLDLMKKRGFIVPARTNDSSKLTMTEKKFLYCQVAGDNGIRVSPDVRLLFNTIFMFSMSTWRDNSNDVVNSELNLALKNDTTREFTIPTTEPIRWSIESADSKYGLSISDMDDHGAGYVLKFPHLQRYVTKEGLYMFFPSRTEQFYDYEHLVSLLDRDIRYNSDADLEEMKKFANEVLAMSDKGATRWDLIRVLRANFACYKFLRINAGGSFITEPKPEELSKHF